MAIPYNPDWFGAAIPSGKRGSGMAKIKGTNGDDTLVGTADNDFINSLLGIDSVDGGAGYDVLTIDYGAVEGSVFPGNVKVNDDGTLSGGLSSGVFGAPNATGFENVERLVYTGSQDVDYITVDLGTLAFSAKRLAMDGGAGDDVLVLDAAQNASGLSFTAAENGLIGTNAGNFANWETFDIFLGAAKPNTVTTFAGDDRVTTRGIRDTIDLGAGEDTWSGAYGTRADSLKLIYSDANGARLSAGGKAIATVKNLEILDVDFGTGSNVASLLDGRGFLFAYEGSDDTLDYRTTARALTVTVAPHLYGGLTGTITEQVNPTPLNIGGFEYGTVKGGVGANSFTFDGSERRVEAYDTAWTFLGGRSAGDTLTLNLQAQIESIVGAGEDGVRTLTENDTSGTYLRWSSIESLTVRFGTGPNRIESGVAQNVVVYGGADLDTVDFENASAGATIDLGSTAGQGNVGGTFTLFSVEGFIGSQFNDILIDSAASNTVRGGGGDDRVYSSAASTAGEDVYSGETGTDLISYALATSAVTVSLGLMTLQQTGGGGADLLIGFEDLFGSKFADTLTGDDGANAIGGFEGDDRIEGLGGDDALDGGAGVNTVAYANASAGVTVSLATGTATGGAGSDTLVNFANVVGSAFADTLKGDANANVLTGGRGADTLTGGGGADTFVFGSKLDSPNSGYDSITDFTRTAGDRIDLRGIDAIEATPRFNDAFSYIGANAFSGAAGELRVVAARGGGWFVYGDTNGDKVADLTIHVDGAQPPLPADILL